MVVKKTTTDIAKRNEIQNLFFEEPNVKTFIRSVKTGFPWREKLNKYSITFVAEFNWDIQILSSYDRCLCDWSVKSDDDRCDCKNGYYNYEYRAHITIIDTLEEDYATVLRKMKTQIDKTVNAWQKRSIKKVMIVMNSSY